MRETFFWNESLDQAGCVRGAMSSSACAGRWLKQQKGAEEELLEVRDENGV